MNYRNARYISASVIDCEIEHPQYGWIPYTLDPSDTDETIDNNTLLSAMTENADVTAYVPPTQDELDAEEASIIRNLRDQKLKTEVDPIAGNALRWNDLSQSDRDAWAAYRIDLLNITDQAGFPYNITWPTKP